MADLKQQQMEALGMISEYIEKLVPAMEEVSAELVGEMKEDTVDFLNQIIDAFNFVIEAYNGTRDLINETEELINDKVLDEQVNEFSAALKTQDYPKVGKLMQEGIVDFLKVYKLRAREILG